MFRKKLPMQGWTTLTSALSGSLLQGSAIGKARRNTSGRTRNFSPKEAEKRKSARRRHGDVPVLHLHHRRGRRQRGLRDRINNTSAEHIAPRLLRNMAFLKLHKNIAFQNVLRVSKNVSPVNPVLNRVAQDMELCQQPRCQHGQSVGAVESPATFRIFV